MVDGFGIRAQWVATTRANISAEILKLKISQRPAIVEPVRGYLIEVDFDTTNIGGTNRYHAEETVFPTTK